MEKEATPVMEKKWPPLEKKWPPLEDCPQYKYRYITPFVIGRYTWEDEENIQDWYAKYAFGSESKEIMDLELESAKKFLHEMRATRGYGNQHASRFLVRPFTDFAPHERDDEPDDGSDDEPDDEPDDERKDPIIGVTVKLILAHISERTGRSYELVDLVKFLVTDGLLLLVTIDAKECVPGSDTETFYAAVSFIDKEVLECFLKPDYDAPTFLSDFTWCEKKPINGFDESIFGPDHYFRSEEMKPGSEPLVPFHGHRFHEVNPNRTVRPTLSISVPPVQVPALLPRIIDSSHAAADSQFFSGFF